MQKSNLFSLYNIFSKTTFENGIPILPAFNTFNSLFKISNINDTVVVLPLVPVTQIFLTFECNGANSISLIMGIFRFEILFIISILFGMPGDFITKSQSKNLSE